MIENFPLDESYRIELLETMEEYEVTKMSLMQKDQYTMVFIESKSDKHIEGYNHFNCYISEYLKSDFKYNPYNMFIVFITNKTIADSLLEKLESNTFYARNFVEVIECNETPNYDKIMSKVLFDNLPLTKGNGTLTHSYCVEAKPTELFYYFHSFKTYILKKIKSNEQINLMCPTVGMSTYDELTFFDFVIGLSRYENVNINIVFNREVQNEVLTRKKELIEKSS